MQTRYIFAVQLTLPGRTLKFDTVAHHRFDVYSHLLERHPSAIRIVISSTTPEPAHDSHLTSTPHRDPAKARVTVLPRHDRCSSACLP